MAAVPNPDKTGEIRSASAGSGQHALTSNTSIVIGGASGDLAKKKASRRALGSTRGLWTAAQTAWAALGARTGRGSIPPRMTQRAAAEDSARTPVDNNPAHASRSPHDRNYSSTGTLANARSVLPSLPPAPARCPPARLTTTDFPGLVRAVPERIPPGWHPHHRLRPLKDGQGGEAHFLTEGNIEAGIWGRAEDRERGGTARRDGWERKPALRCRRRERIEWRRTGDLLREVIRGPGGMTRRARKGCCPTGEIPGGPSRP